MLTQTLLVLMNGLHLHRRRTRKTSAMHIIHTLTYIYTEKRRRHSSSLQKKNSIHTHTHLHKIQYYMLLVMLMLLLLFMESCLARYIMYTRARFVFLWPCSWCVCMCVDVLFINKCTYLNRIPSLGNAFVSGFMLSPLFSFCVHLIVHMCVCMLSVCIQGVLAISAGGSYRLRKEVLKLECFWCTRCFLASLGSSVKRTTAPPTPPPSLVCVYIYYMRGAKIEFSEHTYYYCLTSSIAKMLNQC